MTEATLARDALWLQDSVGSINETQKGLLRMKQQVSQRRISVDGRCDEWIRRTVAAVKATGMDPIEVDGAMVRAESSLGRKHTSITAKYQASAGRCVMHITTFAHGWRRGHLLCDAFLEELFNDAEPPEPTG